MVNTTKKIVNAGVTERYTRTKESADTYSKHVEMRDFNNAGIVMKNWQTWITNLEGMKPDEITKAAEIVYSECMAMLMNGDAFKTAAFVAMAGGLGRAKIAGAASDAYLFYRATGDNENANQLIRLYGDMCLEKGI